MRPGTELAWSIVSDTGRDAPDRLSALRYVNDLLVRPTGVGFEQTRRDLEAACGRCRDAGLAEAMARSAMRAAFLEALEPGDVQAVLERLQKADSPAAREASQALLAEAEAQREAWGYDAKKHGEAAERLVQGANLDAAGRQAYRQLIADGHYRDEPVGEGGGWWILGKFLWNRHAQAAATEAFRNYLQTRSPSSEPDGRLREAVHLLRQAQEEAGQDPAEFWSGVCLLARGPGARALVAAMIEELQGPNRDTRGLIAIGKRALQKGPRPEVAEAVIRLVPFSTEDLSALAEPGRQDRQAKQANLMLAIALTREGKYEESMKYVDTTLAEPLPGVPLFRVVGLADGFFAAARYEQAEALARALLRRNPGATQSVSLLAYLMTKYLDADRFDDGRGCRGSCSDGTRRRSRRRSQRR